MVFNNLLLGGCEVQGKLTDFHNNNGAFSYLEIRWRCRRREIFRLCQLYSLMMMFNACVTASRGFMRRIQWLRAWSVSDPTCSLHQKLSGIEDTVAGGDSWGKEVRLKINRHLTNRISGLLYPGISCDLLSLAGPPCASILVRLMEFWDTRRCRTVFLRQYR